MSPSYLWEAEAAFPAGATSRYAAQVFCVFVFVAGATSIQFSLSVVPDSLRPHGLQHARPPCPSPTPGACLNLEDLSSPTRAWPGPG